MVWPVFQRPYFFEETVTGQTCLQMNFIKQFRATWPWSIGVLES